MPRYQFTLPWKTGPEIIFTPEMMFNAVNDIMIDHLIAIRWPIESLQHLIDNEMGKMPLADQMEVIDRIAKSWASLKDNKKKQGLRPILWKMWNQSLEKPLEQQLAEELQHAQAARQLMMLRMPAEQPVEQQLAEELEQAQAARQLMMLRMPVGQPVEQPVQQPVALRKPTMPPTRVPLTAQNIFKLLRLDPGFEYINQEVYRAILDSRYYRYYSQSDWDAMTKAERIWTAINNYLNIPGSPRELRYLNFFIKPQIGDILKMFENDTARVLSVPNVPIPGKFEDPAEDMCNPQ